MIFEIQNFTPHVILPGMKKSYFAITGIRDYHGESEIVIPSTVDGVEISSISTLNAVGDYSLIDIMNKVKKIIIPNTIEIIDYDAFTGFNFSEFEIPQDSKLKFIFANAFMGCKYLESIYIPSSIKTISSRAFYNCQNLKSIEFGDNSNLQHLEYMSFALTGLEKVVFPTTIKELDIDMKAFTKCSNLVEVDMSKAKIPQIRPETFAYCENLNSIHFPKSLYRIGNFAFRGIGTKTFDLSYCDNLQEISYGAFSENIIYNFQLPYFSNAKVSSEAFYKVLGFDIKRLLSLNPFIEIKEKDFPI